MLPRNPYPPGFEEFGEEGLGDPLGDFSDVSSFDIIQFLSGDKDTPVDSPSDPSRANMHPQRNIQNHVPDPQHNLMFQNSARLPDSPPITDISGAGSSGSPSSNSDPPYSPENYGNYPLIHNQVNSQGLILGVHDLQNGMMVAEHMQTHNRAQQQHQLPSPQSVCFMSPYPPSQPTPATLPQVSPPANRGNEAYMMNNGYGGGQMGLFDMLGGSSEGSINSQCSEGRNLKRQRLDNDNMKFMPSIPHNVPTPASTSPHFDENFSSHQQVIKFSKFEEEKWLPLYDEQHNELQQLQAHVVADKGFNFSVQDNCFVNQKKNHFQISVHIEAIDSLPPRFVKKNGLLYPVKEFKLAFCGVKSEMTSSEIQIKQSQTDRRPIPHAPVVLEIHERRMTKVTVPRLHFQDTTMNNQRKNFRPNPDQKYFLLVVRLKATTDDGEEHLIQAYNSERVIVRATNPGSFEPPESDAAWQRGGSSLYTHNQVVIGADQPVKDARLTVNGDIFSAGRLVHPSDRRLKENITPMDANDALERIQRLHVVNYFYKPEIADKWGLTEEQRRRTGVIAQELAGVIPDAVHDIGDYLTVDENRVFYETILATQELCRLTGDLDSKIDEKVEEISQRLAKYARRKKMLGSRASNLSGDTGIDNKSMLSYSRSSLASYSPSMKKEKRDRNRCRSHCSQPEPLCSSKLTQGTIVTLVVVMAVCLIAMSALYVLDWHNRNYGYHHFDPNAVPKDKPPTDGVAAMTYLIDHPYLPMLQPDAPPLLSHCPSGNCHTYCCADRAVYNTGHEASNLDSIVMIGEQNKNLVARSAPGLENGKGKPLSSGVTIRIPSLNTTIDNRYCIESSCSKKRGRFSLYIPVSPFLPTVPVDVVFSVPRGKVINNCGYLANFQHKNCALDTDPFKQERKKMPTAVQLGESTYELSVGTYLQSAYRFRVGYTTESCFSSEDHMIGGYEEYNLVFYRTCAPSTAPTEPPF